MNKQMLIESATQLKQPSSESAQAFGAIRESFASCLNKAMTGRKDILSLIGENNIDMMQNNHRNHARYLESVFLDYDPVSFVETIVWVLRTYRAHGFQVAYWPAMLDVAVQSLSQELAPNVFKEIEPFYNWMIIHVPQFTLVSETTNSAWEQTGQIHE